jgi:ATP-dependent Clp protease ATP-binding subunit ClpC
MSNKFTEKAEKALNNAIPIAQGMGHTYVGTEHILLALSREKTSLANTFLQKHGIDYKKIEGSIRIYAGNGPKSKLTPTDMTPRCRKLLELSYKSAQKHGAARIGTEHILLAIIEERECIARKILEHLGADISRIKDDILTLMRGAERNALAPTLDSTCASLPLLSQYGKELTSRELLTKTDPIIGREAETDRLIRILCRKNKNNPCLLGEAGVGKTAIVEGLAQKIILGNVPRPLIGKRIFSVDLTSMVAGTKYRGDFEERIKSIVREVSTNRDVILFIDEIHTIVGAGAAEGAIDAANILKPELSRGEIQIIGATTLSEYRKTIEKDPALERRFQPLSINEPDDAATIRILKGVKERYEAFHDVSITDAALYACLNLSKQYMQDRFLPDKALDLLDEACAKKRIVNASHSFYNSEEKNEQKSSSAELSLQSDDCFKNLCLRYPQCFNNGKHVLDIAEIKEDEKKHLIDEKQIQEIVTEITGIPLRTVNQRNAARLEDVLNAGVLGQRAAVNSLSKAIRRHQAGLSDPSRPVGVFLFLGESGVGKTELAKALTRALFSSEKAIIRYDMSEFMEKHSVSKLIGAPPGYVGYEEGGALTEKIRRRPYSVVLFDEIEKAHPDVLNILLQIADDGTLTDNTGHTVNFRHSVIILTSNIGADNFKGKGTLGFLEDRGRTKLTEKLKDYFRPEFINRLDEIILFSPLTVETLTEIARKQAMRLTERAESLGYTLTIESEVLVYIAKKSAEKGMGARPLSRIWIEEIEDPLSRVIVEEKPPCGSKFTVQYDAESDTLHFQYKTTEMAALSLN